MGDGACRRFGSEVGLLLVSSAMKGEDRGMRERLAFSGRCLLIGLGTVTAADRTFADEVSWPAPQEGRKFVQVSAGDSHACAVRDDGVVRCWGNNFQGKADPPAMPYSQVLAGGDHTCVLDQAHSPRGGGMVLCWGFDFSADDLPPIRLAHEGPNFIRLSESSGSVVECGIRSGGKLDCWGSKELLRSMLREMPLPSGKFIQVTGGWPGCGLRADGTVACWGSSCRKKTGTINPECRPEGAFQQISGGLPSGCGIMKDRRLKCWGDEEIRKATPSGEFKHVDSGYERACAVRNDTGAIVCWGLSRQIMAGIPGGRFQQVSIGSSFACALTVSGAVVCWGNNDYGQSTPPRQP